MKVVGGPTEGHTTPQRTEQGGGGKKGLESRDNGLRNAAFPCT